MGDGNFPVDTQAIVQNRDTPIGLWMVEFVAFVLKYSSFGKNDEPMSETAWNEKLSVIVFGQFYGYMFAIGQRALANVYSHVKYSAFYAAYQFALGKWWVLEVKSTHYTVGRHTFVVLTEVDAMSQNWSNLLIEHLLREAFEKISSYVFENMRFED